MTGSFTEDNGVNRERYLVNNYPFDCSIARGLQSVERVGFESDSGGMANDAVQGKWVDVSKRTQYGVDVVVSNCAWVIVFGKVKGYNKEMVIVVG